MCYFIMLCIGFLFSSVLYSYAHNKLVEELYEISKKYEELKKTLKKEGE
jgi:hypothetical protein